MYLNWIEQNEYDLETVCLVVAVCVHYLFILLSNIISYFVYHIEHPFMEKYKSNDYPWPWYEDPQGWREMVIKSIKVTLTNNFIVLPIVAMGEFALGMHEWSFAVEDLPSATKLGLTLAFCMMCEDCVFFFGHRFLHEPWIYPYIHKIHHEYKVSISITVEYCHPFEYFFSDLMPAAVGIKILGPHMHFTTMLIWYWLRSLESFDSHCGYAYSWSVFRFIPW
mmetsp:Transcript_23004/g.16313  ORF Transcript_23004/g.16313 Transcript_23004/m.16313 type:complete len:222 (+) Transcript_23004:141-806(+)